MEFGLTEFIAKILLYTEKKQMSFGTIRNPDVQESITCVEIA